MGIIDTSGIDETKPTTGTALTADVRANFAAINTAFDDVNTRTATNKVAAVLLVPAAGAMLFVGGTDGGWFKGITGSSGYSDNSGAYCGTQFIPTGGDGSSAWVRVDGGYNVGLGYQPEWFGALGDGVAVDGSYIQTMLTAGIDNILLSSGAEYLIDAGLTATSKVKISGYGSKITSTITGDNALLTVSTSDFGLYGLEVEGIGNSSYVAGNNLIEVTGTNSTPSAPTYLSNIKIKDCYLHDCGDYAIRMQYVEDSDVLNNRITSCARTGVGILSGHRCHVNDNHIFDITPGDGSGDAYGVFFSKKSAPVIEDPACSNCTCSDNVVVNVPSWTALDTHGGQYITFSGNTIKNTKLGITLTKSDDGAGQEVSACEYCAVTGNTMEGVNGSYGVIVTGITAGTGAQTLDLYPIGNSITGNSIKFYGNPTNANSGAINLDITKLTSVTGNTIDYAGACGIALGSNNYGFSITGNSIKDPWSDTVTAPRYISTRSTNNYGSITGNSLYRDDTAYGTYVGVRGIELNSSTTEVNAFSNYNEAVNPYIIGSSGKFLNPPIIEIGAETDTASTGSTILDIPVTFDSVFSAIPSIRVTTNKPNGSAGGTNGAYAISATTSGFTIRIATADLANFSAAHVITAYWDASGY